MPKPRKRSGLNIQLKNVSVRNRANVLSLAVIDDKVIIMGEQQVVSFSKDMNVTLEEVLGKPSLKKKCNIFYTLV